jgi:hypothetical protein
LPEILQLDTIEDIEQVFRLGRLVEVRAVLDEPKLAHIWETPEGRRALAIITERINRRRMISRAELRAKQSHGEHLGPSDRRIVRQCLCPKCKAKRERWIAAGSPTRSDAAGGRRRRRAPAPDPDRAKFCADHPAYALACSCGWRR